MTKRTKPTSTKGCPGCSAAVAIGAKALDLEGPWVATYEPETAAGELICPRCGAKIRPRMKRVFRTLTQEG